MQFQTLIMTILFGLLASNQAQAKGDFNDSCLVNPTRNCTIDVAPLIKLVTGAPDAGDTVVCSLPGEPGKSTTLTFGKNKTLLGKGIFELYTQEGMFIPLTAGDHPGMDVEITYPEKIIVGREDTASILIKNNGWRKKNILLVCPIKT